MLAPRFKEGKHPGNMILANAGHLDPTNDYLLRGV